MTARFFSALLVPVLALAACNDRTDRGSSAALDSMPAATDSVGMNEMRTGDSAMMHADSLVGDSARRDTSTSRRPSTPR
jgi:hypothetical protein